MTWVLDCDGVVWLMDEAIPGATEAVGILRSSGARVVFVTNNSFPRRSDHVAKLDRLGIATDPADVLTSAMAAACLLEPGERALVIGGPGIVEELEARGVEVHLAGTGAGTRPVPDAVVVGVDQGFDYAKLAEATTALRSGARLIGTNDDSTYPTPNGVVPGAGSLLAAVATAGGKTAEIAGKPYLPTADLVHREVGAVRIVVGDRPSTDGLLARQLSSQFGLVLTGVTSSGHGPIDPPPDVEAPDLLTLVRRVLGS